MSVATVHVAPATEYSPGEILRRHAHAFCGADVVSMGPADRMLSAAESALDLVNVVEILVQKGYEWTICRGCTDKIVASIRPR